MPENEQGEAPDNEKQEPAVPPTQDVGRNWLGKLKKHLKDKAAGKNETPISINPDRNKAINNIDM
jgi:hypothetical protein